MEIGFLENGIDSLQKGFSALKKYEKNLYVDDEKSVDRFFSLKEAILSTQHGIEILLKFLLLQNNQLLIFSQIDSKVKQAYAEQRSRNLKSIFQTSYANSIHTITYRETIDRVKSILGIDLPEKLTNKLYSLENYRNQIMHSEIFFEESKIANLFDGFLDEIDILFLNLIGTDYKTMTSYKNLKDSYELIENYLSKNKQDLKIKSIRCFSDIFDTIGVSMGYNEVKRITDIEKAEVLFNKLFDSGLTFGADLYNGFCSGDVQWIKRGDNSDFFTIYTGDNDSEYSFRFGSVIIFFPEALKNTSPQLFIEALEDNETKKRFSNDIEKDYSRIKYLRKIVLKNDSSVITGGEEISRFLSSSEYDHEYDYEDYVRPEYSLNFSFITKGIFCFINIQGLDYGNAKGIMYNSLDVSGKEFEVLLRNAIEK